MTQRSANYPLDVIPQYTVGTRDGIGANIAPIGESAGVVHYSNGDLRTHVIYGLVRKVARDTYTTLAFADLIDTKVHENDAKLNAVDGSLATAQNAVSVLAQSVQALTEKVDKLTAFLAVTIPPWRNKEEVENGDDMGMSTQSAADLGLQVVYQILQREPSFDHEEVVSIDPPLGALVERGSTVTVTINLEG